MLLNISSVYLEKRNFSEALKCLDEAEKIAGDKLPDVFFKRSQARTYNKYSSEKDLELAMQDIEQAFKSLEVFNEKNKDNFMSKNNKQIVYSEHKEILKKIIEKREFNRNNKIQDLLNHSKESLKIFKEKKLIKENCLYRNGNDQIRQFKILREMRSKYLLALKFFTETKNEEQLKILYKEIEGFLDNYSDFLIFIELDCMNLDPKLESRISQENPELHELLSDDLFQDFVNDYRFRACEEVFSNYNYNFELFKYALEKIFDDERKEKEKEEAKNPKPSFFSNFSFTYSKGGKNWIYIMFTITLIIGTIAFMGYSGIGEIDKSFGKFK